MTSRGRAVWVLLSVFVAGAVTGVFLDRHLAAPSHEISDAEELHAVAMAELTERLDLDQQQVAAIHALMAERQEIVQRTWEQLRPEVQEAMTELHFDIAELLRPGQRELFHEWLTTQRRRSEQQRH